MGFSIRHPSDEVKGKHSQKKGKRRKLCGQTSSREKKKGKIPLGKKGTAGRDHR